MELSQMEINAIMYSIFMIFLAGMLIVDIARFIRNRKIEYGFGALLWTVMIVAFR